MKTSFKKQPKEVWTRPISKKAYYGFVNRIRETFKNIPSLMDRGTVFCRDFEVDIRETLDMLDRHLAGEKWNQEKLSIFSRLAFSIILPEVDKAMQRSAAAKARAAIRRQKAAQTTNQPAMHSALQSDKQSGAPSGTTIRPTSKISKVLSRSKARKKYKRFNSVRSQ